MANVGFVVEMSIFYVYSLAMAFTEETPTNLKPNLMKVYELESTNILLSITKSVVGLSMFLRGATVYFYIGTLACMFIPIITNSHPYFYVPWLLVALFRCVVFNLFLLMSGFCVCVIFSPIKPACMEFIFIKMLESVIYSYFWLKINRKYVELCRQTGIKYVPFLRHFQSRAEFLSQEVAYRRRRLRTLGNRVPPPPSNRPPPPCVSVDDLDCSSDSDYSLSSLRDSEMTKGSRSLDSLFTKATMDWFIKEALVHQSVEKDDARYEEGLAKRAAAFLQRTLGQKPRSARSDEFEVITNLLPLHTTQRYDPSQDEETPVAKETRAVGNREVCSRESKSTCVEEEIPLTADGETLDTCFDDANSCVKTP
ncbi:unnamed protein product [Bemisia tabaci]|uniref:Uncharacterized protein n=1 Tax=Bemisia tabaci TaxID=7038 RepID=A0A9P0A6V2_BEMTA|nr:unnamed protein product [Bemisia tabaci]